MLTEIGAIDLDIPRDRLGTFDPQLVPKHARRLEGFNANIVHLYARGLSTRDIRRELTRMYQVEMSPALISKVTDGIIDELNEWQARPLDAVYPILYIDALVVKVRTGGTVTNRAAYLGVGVDVEGRNHVLGVWLGDGGEGAKCCSTAIATRAFLPISRPRTQGMTPPTIDSSTSTTPVNRLRSGRTMARR